MEPVHETYSDSQPRHEPHNLDAQRLFLQHLDFITTTASCACRRSRLSHEDTQDFCSWVIVRLMSENFRVLRSCHNSAAIRSFLRTTIRGLLNDYRNHLWGKWRPSKEAKRLGPAAIDLERLWRRDGYRLSEAIELLYHNSHGNLKRSDLEVLARRLPWRRPSRTGPDTLLEDVDIPVTPEQHEGRFHLRQIQGSAHKALREALAKLPRLDRKILYLHYYKGETIAAVARRLGLQQRSLYSIRNRCLGRLRRDLQSRGFCWRDLRSIIGWDDTASPPSAALAPIEGPLLQLDTATLP